MSRMVQLIQEIANNAEQAGQPVAILYGVVSGVNPLRILVEQKMEIDESMLTLTDEVRDHYIDINIPFIVTLPEDTPHTHLIRGTTETGGEDDHVHRVELTTQENTMAHTHNIEGDARVLVKNGLQVGEGVTLLRFQKGQQFLVLSRTEARA